MLPEIPAGLGERLQVGVELAAAFGAGIVAPDERLKHTAGKGASCFKNTGAFSEEEMFEAAHALHGDPNVSDGPATQVTMSTESLTVATIVDEYLVLQFPRNLAADDVEVVVQSSGDLAIWVGAGMVLVEEINHGDGSATLRYRSAVPYDQLPPRPFIDCT